MDRTAYHRQYYLENKDRIKKRNHKYYLQNKEIIQERNLLWVEKNLESIKEYHRQYWKQNKDSIMEKRNKKKPPRPDKNTKIVSQSDVIFETCKIVSEPPVLFTPQFSLKFD